MKRHRKSPLKRIVFLSLFLMLVSIALGNIFVILHHKLFPTFLVLVMKKSTYQ